MTPPLMEAREVVKHFRLPGGWLAADAHYVHALDGVSLEVQRGEVLGIVGESGCGKTTLGRVLLGLIPPTSGQVLFKGQDLSHLPTARMRDLRKELQIVFQNPSGSLSPRMRVLDIVAEPLRTHRIASSREDIHQRVIGLLDLVGLGEELLPRYPHELSGGQCQRVAVARVLALNPSLIVLDEPTSALDVSVQAQLINLLEELRHRSQLTYIFISHDLSVVQHISDRIGVMYLGKLVEIGPTEAIFDQPLHPYTRALLSAVPLPVFGQKREQIILEGAVPNPVEPPTGCRFHTRCRYAEDICRQTEPALVEIRAGRQAACHLVDRINTPTTGAQA
jgi:oligopeptide/dipeptide ABC transporter ATP-binding protein